MLRGGLVIFVAINSVIFLRKKYFPHHYMGVGLVVVGITMVGVSSVLKGGGDRLYFYCQSIDI